MRYSLYGNNTEAIIDPWMHAEILRAIDAGGVFGEELGDLFRLTKCPEGSACGWVLNWV